MMPSRVRFSDWLHHVETKRFITVGRLDTAVAWLATDSVPLSCLIRTPNTSYGAGQVYIRFNGFLRSSNPTSREDVGLLDRRNPLNRMYT